MNKYFIYKHMGKIKLIVIAIYTLLLFLLWQQVIRFLDFIGGIISVVVVAIIAYLVTGVMVMFWLAVTYYVWTNVVIKYFIRKRMAGLEKELGNVARTEIVTYKKDKKSDDIIMEFYSRGVEKECWDSKREAVETAINYTIIGDIEYDKWNWSIITFRARKGRIQTNEEILLDEDF